MPVADYWGLVLVDLENSVSKSNYKAWLENLEFVSTSLRGIELNLSVGSRFGKEYIQKKLIIQIQNSVQKYFPKILKINFLIRPNPENQSKIVQKTENNSSSFKKNLVKKEHKNSQNLNFSLLENLENSENLPLDNQIKTLEIISKKTGNLLDTSLINHTDKEYFENFKSAPNQNSHQSSKPDDIANNSQFVTKSTILAKFDENKTINRSKNSTLNLNFVNQRSENENFLGNLEKLENKKLITQSSKPEKISALSVSKLQNVENLEENQFEIKRSKIQIKKTESKDNSKIEMQKSSKSLIAKTNLAENPSSFVKFKTTIESKNNFLKTFQNPVKNSKISETLMSIAQNLGQKISCNINKTDRDSLNQKFEAELLETENKSESENPETTNNQATKKAQNRKINNTFQPFSSIPSKKIVKIDEKNKENRTQDLTQITPIDNSKENFDQNNWQNKTQSKGNFRDNNSISSEPSAFPSSNLNGLNPKYTLENLVIAGHNELAVSVAKSILRQLGTLYNPVFIHSKVGLGKTHLLQAIGQKALENEPSLKIKYATCETFFNHYLTSIQKNQSAQFRHYYRNVDLLLLDDIQFINGKNSTQEAFFHTFNELHEQNKQIIITSDKAPEFLGLIEDRLISRFKWGMVVDITDPNLEDRLAILRDKVERAQILLSENQILQIAETVTANVRDLEGVLNQIKAKLSLGNQIEISQAELENILKINILASENTLTKTPEKALQVVAKIYGTTHSELIGKSRDKNISTARQILMYLWHKNFGLSLPIIGKMLKRDHTTILHGTQKIHKEIQMNSEIKNKLNEIFQLLN